MATYYTLIEDWATGGPVSTVTGLTHDYQRTRGRPTSGEEAQYEALSREFMANYVPAIPGYARTAQWEPAPMFPHHVKDRNEDGPIMKVTFRAGEDTRKPYILACEHPEMLLELREWAIQTLLENPKCRYNFQGLIVNKFPKIQAIQTTGRANAQRNVGKRKVAVYKAYKMAAEIFDRPYPDGQFHYREANLLEPFADWGLTSTGLSPKSSEWNYYTGNFAIVPISARHYLHKDVIIQGVSLFSGTCAELSNLRSLAPATLALLACPGFLHAVQTAQIDHRRVLATDPAREEDIRLALSYRAPKFFPAIMEERVSTSHHSRRALEAALADAYQFAAREKLQPCQDVDALCSRWDAQLLGRSQTDMKGSFSTIRPTRTRAGSRSDRPRETVSFVNPGDFDSPSAALEALEKARYE